MTDLVKKLDQVEEMLKHQPGRHDQQRHAGTRGMGGEEVQFTQRMVDDIGERIADRMMEDISENIRAEYDGEKFYFDAFAEYPSTVNRPLKAMQQDMPTMQYKVVPSKINPKYYGAEVRIPEGDMEKYWRKTSAGFGS